MSYKELAEQFSQTKPGLFLSPIMPMEPSMNSYEVKYISFCNPPSIAGLQPAEYGDWREDEISWHETCYVHTALNPTQTVKFWGPDSLKFCKKYMANTFDDGFPVGKAKHAIMCDEKGRDMMDGMLLKTGEEEYISNWLSPWLIYCIITSGMNIQFENISENRFLFQLGGPKSLEILEAAGGDNLHDIKFIHHRMSKIAGKEVRILRMGMAGSLAYEVHGQIEDSHIVLTQILKAGKKYGMRRLGMIAYIMTHCENGFPQAFLAPSFLLLVLQ